MSDFMKFRIESIKDKTIAVRVWFYSESYRFQNTIDWMFFSLSLCSEELNDLFNEVYFEIQRQQDPDLEPAYYYVVDIEAETLPEVSAKVIQQMEITDIKNQNPSDEYWNGDLPFEQHLEASPNALYLVTFTDKKFTEPLSVGREWTSPCFDLLNATWTIQKEDQILEIEFEDSFHESQTVHCKQWSYPVSGNKYDSERIELPTLTTYSQVLEYVKELKQNGWLLINCNHAGNAQLLKFKENEFDNNRK